MRESPEMEKKVKGKWLHSSYFVSLRCTLSQVGCEFLTALTKGNSYYIKVDVLRLPLNIWFIKTTRILRKKNLYNLHPILNYLAAVHITYTALNPFLLHSSMTAERTRGRHARPDRQDPCTPSSYPVAPWSKSRGFIH